jgi:hypothetical protein
MFACAMHRCVCMAKEQKDLMREKELHWQSRSERTSVEINISEEQEFTLFKTYCKGS